MTDWGKRSRAERAKIARKNYLGFCVLCGSPHEGDLLNAHRLTEGADGGRYVWDNILPLCGSCHDKVHRGHVKIHGRHPSTSGSYVIHWTDEQGQDRWEKEDRWRERPDGRRVAND